MCECVRVLGFDANVLCYVVQGNENSVKNASVEEHWCMLTHYQITLSHVV